MNGELTAEALMSKAGRACASARALLGLDDVDGACNRAYYAMFDAAARRCWHRAHQRSPA